MEKLRKKKSVLNFNNGKQANGDEATSTQGSYIRLDNMIAIEKMDTFNSESLISNLSLPDKSNARSEKAIANLKQDIAVIIDCEEISKEPIREDRVYVRLDLLNDYINQNINKQPLANEGNNLAKMLAMEKSFLFDDYSSLDEGNNDSRLSRSRRKRINPKETKAAIAILKEDITSIVSFGEDPETEYADTLVFSTLNELGGYIDQIMNIIFVIKKGGRVFEESLSMIDKKIEEAIFNIKEEVFKVFLRLNPTERIMASREGGLMNSIFSTLGVIEDDFNISFKMINRKIDKRNKKSSKTNKPFRSLPILQTQSMNLDTIQYK